jgi:glycosyltransferase involved in cell wall biosynthesis
LRDGYLKEVRLLREALRETGAPLTHAHWAYEYARAAFAPDLPPAVVTVHDHAGNMLRLLDPRYLPLYFMSHSAFRRAALLTAPSPYIASYVREKAGRDVMVVPNLLEENASVVVVNRDATSKGAPAVLVLASDAAFKNVRGALLAFARWRLRGVAAEMRVVGPGLEPDGAISMWASFHNLADGVQFAGPVTHDEALAAIAKCDILFHPSLEESFGGPVMEAMALGVPVVAAREAGGCRFLLEEGKYGRLPSGRSSDEMAEALNLSWTNKDETSKLSDDAKKRVRALCDPDSALTAYEECYTKLLRRA